MGKKRRTAEGLRKAEKEEKEETCISQLSSASPSSSAYKIP
jgi:hypothetical protein